MQPDQGCDGCVSTLFTVDNIPMHERYGIWKESIQCLFEVNAAKHVRENDFRTSIESHLFGSLMLMTVRSRQQKWSRSYAQIAGNGMDHYGIGLYKKGSIQCEKANGGTELPDGGLLVYDLTQPFKATTTDHETVNLVIPRPLIEDLIHQPDDHCMRYLSPTDPVVRIIRDLIVSLERNVRFLSRPQAMAVEKTIPLLLANCLNTASGATRDTAHERQSITSMVRMRRYFRENLASPNLNPRQAAHDLGVSRSKLYNYFSPYGGVYNYIRDMRLRRAMSLLNDPLGKRSSIYDVALACGFSSDASFIRAFREKFGVTPGEVRNGAMVVDHQHFLFDDLVDKRFEDWIHGLN